MLLIIPKFGSTDYDFFWLIIGGIAGLVILVALINKIRNRKD